MSEGEPLLGVDELARVLLASAHHDERPYVHNMDTDELLQYDRGIYRVVTKAEVAHKVEDQEPRARKHTINEVYDKLMRRVQPLHVEDFDPPSDPRLVLENCLLNLETLEPEPFTPDYYALNRLNVAFDPQKGCPGPAFGKFINEILAPEDVQGVQEELGAILRKKYLTKKFSIYLGETDTGKTTLINVILAFLAPENVASISIQELASKNPFFLAQLYARLANIRDDVSKDIVYSVGKLKELTGGFQVTAQKKFKDPFEFESHAYLIFTCNNLPPIEEDDQAFFNRVMIRHFTKRFGGNSRPDRELVKKLTTPDELSGILNWALEALERLRANDWNFSNTSTSDATREEYKRRSDPVWAFVRDCLEEESSSALSKERLYNAFKAYCSERSIPLLSRDGFFKTLPEKINVTSGQRQLESEGGKKHCFVGVRFQAGLEDLGLSGEKGVPPVPHGPLDSLREQSEQPEQAFPHLRSVAESPSTRPANPEAQKGGTEP